MQNVLEFFSENIGSLTTYTILLTALAVLITVTQTYLQRKLKKAEEKTVINQALTLINERIIGKARGDLRTSILLVKPSREGEVLKPVFSAPSSFFHEAKNIVYQKWQGVPGKAWGYESGVVGDMYKTDNAKDFWNLTQEQESLLNNIKVSYAIPIHDPERHNIIGILVIDSKEALSDEFKEEDFYQKTADVSAFIATLLKTFGYIK